MRDDAGVGDKVGVTLPDLGSIDIRRGDALFRLNKAQMPVAQLAVTGAATLRPSKSTSEMGSARRRDGQGPSAMMRGLAARRLATVVRRLVLEGGDSPSAGIVEQAVGAMLKGDYEAAVAQCDEVIAVSGASAGPWVMKIALEPWCWPRCAESDHRTIAKETVRRCAAHFGSDVVELGGLPIKAVIFEMNLDLLMAVVAQGDGAAAHYAGRASDTFAKSRLQKGAAIGVLASSMGQESGSRKSAGYAAGAALAVRAVATKHEGQALGRRSHVVQMASDSVLMAAVALARDLALLVRDRPDASCWASTWVETIRQRLLASMGNLDDLSYGGMRSLLELPRELTAPRDGLRRAASERRRPYEARMGIGCGVVALAAVVALVGQSIEAVLWLCGVLGVCGIVTAIVAMAQMPGAPAFHDPLVRRLNDGPVDLYTFFSSIQRSTNR